jgi:hypothetical protein
MVKRFFVGNVNAEATLYDLHNLFHQHGEQASLASASRLPHRKRVC